MTEPTNHSGPEADLMDRVDVEDWGPTEPDEMAILERLYPYDPESGAFSSHVGDED